LETFPAFPSLLGLASGVLRPCPASHQAPACQSSVSSLGQEGPATNQSPV